MAAGSEDIWRLVAATGENNGHTAIPSVKYHVAAKRGGVEATANDGISAL